MWGGDEVCWREEGCVEREGEGGVGCFRCVLVGGCGVLGGVLEK